MDVTLNRNQLRRLGGAFHGLLPNRNKKILPVLSHVLIEARDGAVYVTGTDLDTHATLRLEGEVQEPGSLSVPLHALRDVARVLPAGEVHLSIGSRLSGGDPMPTLVLSQADIRFELEGLPEDEFPRPQDFEPSHGLAVPAVELFRLFGAVGFAVSQYDTRPILCGVQWETRDGMLMFCATNGQRLSTMEAPVEVAAMPEMIVNPKALAAAQKLFSPDGEILVTRSENRIAMTVGGNRIVSRLIEGPYPNWRQVVPKESNLTAVFERPALQKAVARALVLSNPDANRRTTIFLGETAADEAWLSTRSQVLGNYGERVPLAEPLDGDPITVGVSAGYLAELLKRIPSEQVRMRCTTPERAILLEPVGEDVPALTLLVMPVRLLEAVEEFPWLHQDRRVA